MAENVPMTTPLASSPAAERNKQPILEVLQRVLPARGTALEIASGNGQHVAWFGAAMRGWIWQPSDAEPQALPAIAARSTEAGLSNVRAPVLLDAMGPRWPSTGPAFTEAFDAIYCANMLHIAPWPACAALMSGAARHLALDGVLVTYGPYLEESVPTAPGNLAFDASLRERDSRWGIRRVADVTAEAHKAGLQLRGRYQMPANNLLLLFGRGH